MRIEKSCGPPAPLSTGVLFGAIPVGGVFRFKSSSYDKVGPYLKVEAGYYIDMSMNRLHSAALGAAFPEYQLLPNAHLCTGEEGK